jgi:hypothetical protein
MRLSIAAPQFPARTSKEALQETGDRGRTGDVQLGNFVSKLTFSFVAAKTYLLSPAFESLLRGSVFSTSFTRSAFVLGTRTSRIGDDLLTWSKRCQPTP